LIGLDTLRFTPCDYQVRAAQFALRRFRGRGLLCDEVGLGETIEAGLVLKEYLLCGMVERVLFLTPLETRFALTGFVASHDPAFRERGSEAWAGFPRVIASLATARRAEHHQAIALVVHDLGIVDEAHHLKSRTSAS